MKLPNDEREPLYSWVSAKALASLDLWDALRDHRIGMEVD